jgi:glycyl-tRNA synthetase
MKWYEFWKEKRMRWHQTLGLGSENYRFHDHLNLAHYANAACDIQFNFPMGFKELEGIHSRTDFDLKSHEKFSGKKLQYFDAEDNQNYIPYVVETSVGLDRMFLSILSKAYTEEKLPARPAGGEDGSDRVVLRIPPALAPHKVAILPLMKKDGLAEKAEAIFNDLKFDFRCFYEDKDNIGKRYRRMDAIGTPYCITIDHQTLQDDTVTIRDRDTMKQERTSISNLKSKIRDSVSIATLLKQI